MRRYEVVKLKFVSVASTMFHDQCLLLNFALAKRRLKCRFSVTISLKAGGGAIRLKAKFQARK